MSYRRACKSCQKKSTVDPVLSATSREACECEGIYRLSDTHLDEIISTGETRVAILPDLVHSFRSGDSTHGPLPNSAEMERQLGLLYTALASTTIALTTDSALFQLALHLTSPRADPKPPSHAEAPTRILMELLRDRADLDEFFCRKAHSVLSQHALARSYEEWLAHVYDKVRHIVAKSHATASVYFESLATTAHESKEDMQNSSSKGFEAFVAQLREVYLAQNYMPPSPSLSSALDGSWRFDATALHILTTSLSPSVLTVARCLSMGLGMHLAQSSQSLFVRSELALFSTIWSEFILDNTPRILRVFPNGESTMSTCADLLYGDYIGSQPPHTNQIRLDLFCWPLENDAHRSCYAIRMLLDASCGGQLQGQVEVQVAHNVTDQNTWNMTAAERVELLRRHDLTTVFVMVAGWQQNTHKDEMNIWV